MRLLKSSQTIPASYTYCLLNIEVGFLFRLINKVYGFAFHLELVFAILALDIGLKLVYAEGLVFIALRVSDQFLHGLGGVDADIAGRLVVALAHVVGTLVGVLILGVLDNGLTQMRVDSYVREILIGAIIIAAVSSSSLSRRK